MHDLSIADDEDHVHTPSNVALAAFKLVNTQLKEDTERTL